MEKVTEQPNGSKPFDIEEMLRDILSIPPMYPERLTRDAAYQNELQSRSGCDDE